MPVEFDASNRANAELLRLGVVSGEEQVHTKKMLGAAALTYVASVISSILNMLRILIMLGGRDD